MHAAVSSCICLSNIKTPSPPPPPPPPPPLPAICLIQPLHGPCVWSPALSSQHGRREWLENLTGCLQDTLFFLLPLSLTSSQPFLILFFPSLFHPLCSCKYPLKQMPLIPLASHYKICPILGEEGGRKKRREKENPLSLFLSHTHMYERRYETGGNKAASHLTMRGFCTFKREEGIPWCKPASGINLTPWALTKWQCGYEKPPSPSGTHPVWM